MMDDGDVLPKRSMFSAYHKLLLAGPLVGGWMPGREPQKPSAQKHPAPGIGNRRAKRKATKRARKRNR